VGNATLEPIEPYLRYSALRAGFRGEVRFSSFAGAVQEALHGGEQVLASSDLALVWLHFDTSSPRLAREFPTLSREDVRSELERTLSELRMLLAGARKQTQATLLCVGFETPPLPALGIADGQSADTGQQAAVRALNDGMRETVAGLGNAYFLDLSQVLARLGSERFYDPRYWHIGRAPFARDALREVAEIAMRYWVAGRGRARKCLVLDCDNVLWGGIAGEEELAGLSLGTEHPGSAFREFQQEVKNLAARGVILALCSKNEPDTVWRVFRDHAGMVLRERDIAASRINWNDKAENLREIAAELNIGLDSLVFLDDSEFEVERVRSALPMVEAVHMPADRAVEYRNLLLAGGWFDTLSISEEDRARGAMYRAEADRRRAREEIPNLESYLRSLEMVAELALAGPSEIARVAQLTQRTNQFNLTARRYSEDDIRALVEDPECDVLTIRVHDRFGDSGLVGAAILRFQGSLAVVDSLLMSCRVLGRGVERVLVETCVDLAARRHCSEIEGHYVRSAKNGLVADFWTDCGFAVTKRDEGHVSYRRRTSDRGSPPGWFKSIVSPIPTENSR
jgi:FkbH-like protein